MLLLADGTQLSGQDVCDALQVSTSFPVPDTMAPAAYNTLMALPGGLPTSPAVDPRTGMRRSTGDVAVSVLRGRGAAAPGLPDEQGGDPVGDIDNAYVSTSIDRRFGPFPDGHNVVVLHGKLPTTPATFRRDPLMQGGTQLRYWSLRENVCS